MAEITIKNLIGRGRPILLLGATGSGKSRLARSITNDNCQRIMKLREGRGMMTIANNKIVVTNSPSIPEGKLIIYGKLPYAEKYLLYDENELLCNILYYSIKAYVDATNKYKTKEEAMDAFTKALDEETSKNIGHNREIFKLGYKIKSNKDIESKIKELIKKFDVVQVKAIYLNTFLNNKGQYIKDLFKDEISKKTLLDFKLKENVDNFWKLIVDSYNEQCDTLLNKFKDFNKTKGVTFDVDSDSNAFAICVSDDDVDNELVKNILVTGGSSISHFISDLTIFSRNEFDDEIKNLSPEHFIDGNEKECYVVKLVDTMGFFHRDDINVSTESEGIIDLLSAEHSNDIIYVLKANDDALNKKSAKILKELKDNCKKEVNIHVCFTHFDEYIIDELNGDDEGLFIDVSEINSALIDSKIEKLSSYYNDFLELDREDKDSKLRIDRDFCYFSYPTINASVDGLLKSHAMEYNNGIIKLVKIVFSDLKRFDINVVGKHKLNYKLNIDMSKLYDINNIYFDLAENITECEKSLLNLHWKTYRAVITRWLNYGVKFLSGAGDDRTGYIRLKTYFIEYISLFLVHSIIPEIELSFEEFKIEKNNSVNEKDFEKNFKKYLSQNLGKKVARDMLDGILKGHAMIYDLRLDMYNILDTCRSLYFPRPNITFNEIELDDKNINFLSIIDRNIKEEIIEFTKLYCTEKS